MLNQTAKQVTTVVKWLSGEFSIHFTHNAIDLTYMLYRAAARGVA